ncbi:MAG: dUTP diphosphatase [Hyphomicrobium sp.]
MISKKIQKIKISVKVLEHAKTLPLPHTQSDGAAGLDLLAAVAETEPLVLRKGERALIPTGLMLELPLGTEAQIRPRSGLALKHGVTVLNSPGTIDSDYRGEVKVLLMNHGDTDYVVQRGDRIAQMVVSHHAPAVLIEAKVLSSTARGAGGFGSTKIRSKPKKTRPVKTEKRR